MNVGLKLSLQYFPIFYFFFFVPLCLCYFVTLSLSPFSRSPFSFLLFPFSFFLSPFSSISCSGIPLFYLSCRRRGYRDRTRNCPR